MSMSTKGHGWSATTESSKSLPGYNANERHDVATARDKAWRTLRKQIQGHGPVRVPRILQQGQ